MVAARLSRQFPFIRGKQRAKAANNKQGYTYAMNPVDISRLRQSGKYACRLLEWRQQNETKQEGLRKTRDDSNVGV